MRTDLSGCTTNPSLSNKPRVVMMFAMEVSYSSDFSQESSMNMTDVCPCFLEYARAGFNNLVNFRGHIASALGKQVISLYIETSDISENLYGLGLNSMHPSNFMDAI